MTCQDLILEPFPFDQLLAFFRGEVRDLAEFARIRQLIEKDVRWKTHWRSLDHWELERAAAIQDGKDLAQFRVEDATPMCREAARSNGRVFLELAAGAPMASGWTRKQWDTACGRSVYCRRMRRWVTASLQAEAAGGELIRDRLLKAYYLEPLQSVTKLLAEKPTPHPLDTPVPLETCDLSPTGPRDDAVLRVVLRGGQFVMITNGADYALEECPRGEVHRWKYQLRGPTRSMAMEPALLAGVDELMAVKARLVFEREYAEIAGRLAIELTLTQDKEVRCKASIQRIRSRADIDLNLRVEYQGVVLMDAVVHGDEFAQERSLSDVDYVNGTVLTVELAQQHQRLVRFAVQFDE